MCQAGAFSCADLRPVFRYENRIDGVRDPRTSGTADGRQVSRMGQTSGSFSGTLRATFPPSLLRGLTSQLGSSAAAVTSALAGATDDKRHADATLFAFAMAGCGTRAAPTFSAERLKAHVTFLADDALEGREAGNAAWNDFLATRYHQPSDDLSQAIKWSVGAKFAQLNDRAVRELPDADGRAQWFAGDDFGNLFAPAASKAAKPGE